MPNQKETMSICIDVAQYILNKLGVITTWKLQKLCYYSQAWSLVWDDKPLFNSRIEAWANGPVIPELYNHHKGIYNISNIGGNPDNLNKTQIDTINVVLETYGDKSSTWLSEFTHNEKPWINARQRARLGPGERGNSEITLDDMAEYYCGLLADIENN